MGCDFVRAAHFKHLCVSIHAPAWGATWCRCCFSVDENSFNPRTRMGCDVDKFLLLDTIRFQSTHPHGVRHGDVYPLFALSGFNPRTRMGCDPGFAGIAKRRAGFNPRTRMGCDFIPMDKVYTTAKFQSTHPHGVRHRAVRPRLCLLCFNPRTRMGCDESSSNCFIKSVIVSIHAPAWGATNETCIQTTLSNCFNPRTRMGCDDLSQSPHCATKSFNPRTRMGCDGATRQNKEVDRGFNPRTRMGCDPVHIQMPLRYMEFQSTHPHGVRHIGGF